MGLKLITPPATDPITLAQAKEHLRYVDDDEDALIAAFIKSATQNVEQFTGRALIDQTWDLVLDSFPTDKTVTPHLEIKIPKPPLIEVTQIEYDDLNGDQIIVPSGNYYVDTTNDLFGWVVPQGTLIWPATIDAINSVRVRFRAGYLNTNSPPTAAVPDDIIAGLKLMLGTLFEHRELQAVGSIATRLPWGVENLLRPHRVLLGLA